jgi:hypothetical protein
VSWCWVSTAAHDQAFVTALTLWAYSLERIWVYYLAVRICNSPFFVSMYIILLIHVWHIVSVMHKQYTQGFFQSRLGTADYAQLIVAFLALWIPFSYMQQVNQVRPNGDWCCCPPCWLVRRPGTRKLVVGVKLICGRFSHSIKYKLGYRSNKTLHRFYFSSVFFHKIWLIDWLIDWL